MRHALIATLATLALASCANTPASAGDADAEPLTGADLRVTSVSASGAPGAYTFSVELRSADTGCEAVSYTHLRAHET